jgi:hypothetical protein
MTNGDVNVVLIFDCVLGCSGASSKYQPVQDNKQISFILFYLLFICTTITT